LRGVNYDELAERAEAQRASVEQQRLRTARKALGSASGTKCSRTQPKNLSNQVENEVRFDSALVVLYRAGCMNPHETKATLASGDSATHGVRIERDSDVLSFTLENPDHGNEITGVMFDAMLAELRAEAVTPRARVLRIRARGKVFCTGRERAGRDVASIRHESARLIELKRSLRFSPLISVAEVQGDAFGFGFGLAILSDFALVVESACLAFPEMRGGLAPAAIMAYLGEYALPRFAFPLVLFGDAVTPQRAVEIGLISQVCPAEKLASEADALVKKICSLDATAARRCKEFFQTAQQNSFEQNCRLATEALTVGSLATLTKAK
jgi:enoyl-CoA hydratase/carnithine racemase